MTFDEIRLTRVEKMWLKRSRKNNVPVDKCERLLRLKFVGEIREQPKSGYQPVATGWCEITPLGIDYLRYTDSEQYRKYIVPVVVSLLTTATANVLWHVLPQWWQWLLQQI